MPRRTPAERLERLNKDIEKLETEKQKILDAQKEKDEKARVHRFCKRMGYIEKLLPDIIPLTDEQFETFIKRTTANGYGRGVLDEMTGKKSASPAAPQGETPKHDGEKSPPKPTGAGTHNNGKPAAPAPAVAGQGGGAVSSDKTDDTETSGA